jgi:hypothetical protein
MQSRVAAIVQKNGAENPAQDDIWLARYGLPAEGDFSQRGMLGQGGGTSPQ